MTYHMERTLMRGRGMRGRGRGRGLSRAGLSPTGPNGEFCRSVIFPEKLYNVMEEGSELITWNFPGDGLIVHADDFEIFIMEKHPGLVQIPTFANFRRQLRWYGFEWQSIGEGNFQFTHKNFLRGRRDLLDAIFNKKQGGFNSFARHSSRLGSSSRVVYKPRGKRGRPRKRREASPTPKPNSAASEEDLHLDEAQLDQVAAVLEQSHNDSILLSTPNSSLMHHPSSFSHTSEHSSGCCHCCCHCCCHSGEYYNYCRPWMPEESKSSDYPNLSYYDEFAPQGPRRVTQHPKLPQLKVTQLGTGHLVAAGAQDLAAGQPVEVILCTPNNSQLTIETETEDEPENILDDEENSQFSSQESLVNAALDDTEPNSLLSSQTSSQGESSLVDVENCEDFIALTNSQEFKIEVDSDFDDSQ